MQKLQSVPDSGVAGGSTRTGYGASGHTGGRAKGVGGKSAGDAAVGGTAGGIAGVGGKQKPVSVSSKESDGETDGGDEDEVTGVEEWSIILELLYMELLPYIGFA